MTNNSIVEEQLKRGFIHLKKQEWKDAQGYFGDALELEPDNAKAYIGLLLADLHLADEETLCISETAFAENNYYQTAISCAQEPYLQVLKNYQTENAYYRANLLDERAKTQEEFLETAALFCSVSDYKDAKAREEQARDKAEKARKEAIYQQGTQLITGFTSDAVKKGKDLLLSLGEYEDAKDLAENCEQRITALVQQEQKAAKKKKRTIKITASVLLVAIVSIIVIVCVENHNQAAIVHEQFLGMTFLGTKEEGEDFDDYKFDYLYGTIPEGKIYKLKTTNRSFVFHEDGKVTAYTRDSLTYWNAPKDSDLSGYNFENEYSYDSFQVTRSLGGTFYVKINGEKYELVVSEDYVPEEILNVDGADLSDR